MKIANAETQAAREDQPPDMRALIRQLARSLALASHSAGQERLDGPKLELARLTAGLDPDRVDSASIDFRFGAAEGLAAVLNGLSEQVLSASSRRLLLKSKRARVLAALAADTTATQKALSERLDIKESNLSKYVRELAGVGLIEPAASTEARGKAWTPSPWGVKALFALLSWPVAGQIPPEELAEALRGARLRHGSMPVEAAIDAQTIPKEEVYRRIEEALKRRSATPVRLTTLFTGDLRQHDRPWRLHESVFKHRQLRRPVEWVLVQGEGTEAWLPKLLLAGEGNQRLTVWTHARHHDSIPTVQVLDDEGLLYPLPPHDEGLVRDRGDAMEGWDSMRRDADLRLDRGQTTA